MASATALFPCSSLSTEDKPVKIPRTCSIFFLSSKYLFKKMDLLSRLSNWIIVFIPLRCSNICSSQMIQIWKKNLKNEHLNKHLTLLVLTEFWWIGKSRISSIWKESKHQRKIFFTHNKVEKIWKGSLDLIPSPSWKFKLWVGKFAWGVRSRSQTTFTRGGG